MDDLPVLHHRTTAAILLYSGFVASTLVTFYLLKVWAYRHPDSSVGQGVLTILG